MNKITKTNYVDYVICPRSLYYFKNNKDEAKELDEQAKKRIDEGNLINDYAHLYFANTIKIRDFKDKVDINKQAELTQEALKKGVPLAEASFIYDDLFCAVDILNVNNDGSYDIYEVKASNEVKPEHYDDCAFQRYVLTGCGLKIRKCFILHLNKDYIRHGDINVQKLFKPYELTEDKLFIAACDSVIANLAALRRMLEENKLPEYGNCYRDCPFFAFCHKDLAKPNVLDLNGIRMTKAHKLIESGVYTFNTLLSNNDLKLNDRQKIQITTTLNPSKNPYINKFELTSFLKNLKYPIYHLDFETMNEAVPPFDGTSPYQQIPFQYSLHIEYGPNGKLDHKEFLANNLDDEYKLAKQLCKDIPLNVTSMAYNMSFEKTILQHLADRFPDLKEHLLNIRENMVDLLVPFKKAYYFDNKQGGSNSIKFVMPALVPGMEEAYHELPVVHNGGEALTMFPKMLKMESKQKDNVRKGMLQYCELDTLSMVKVLNKLWEKLS